MRAATDQRLQQITQSDRQVGAPTSQDLLPWKKGQWATYRMVSGKEKQPTFVRIEILDQSAEGTWIQTETQSYYDRAVARVLYAQMPKDVDEVMDVVKKMVIEVDGQEPQEIDFTQNNPIVNLMKSSMKQHASWGYGSSKVDFQGAKSVKVPAGTFEGCGSYKATVTVLGTSSTSTAFVHPEVPLGGVVRSVSDDGDHLSELVDFGI
ncbi:MAG TPA: hypothetical protein VGD74_11905 [Vulgatibacter sp.]